MKVREALPIAAHVATRKATLPILSTVRIHAGRVVANDLDKEIALPVDLPKGIAGADFCVMADRLVRVLKALPDEQEIELKLKTNRLHVIAGPTRYELNTLPAADFPSLDAGREPIATITAETKPLLSGLKFVAAAMAIQDIRYYLCGLLVTTAPGRIVLTATDGHRLHRAVVRLEDASKLQEARGIVPADSISRVMDTCGRHASVDIALGPDRLLVTHDDESLTTKLIDGNFPDADRVIPASRPVTGTVDRVALGEAIARVAPMLDPKVRGIRVHFQADKITLTAQNAEQELAAEDFAWSPADKSFKGLDVGFSLTYLAEALAAFTTKRVNVHITAHPGDALYLTDGDAGDCCAVVMPMRI